jgi:hypothetical protein
MNAGALAEDAVSIRRLRASGISENAVRRQLAAVPIPATRRFVFVRRVTLRARPDQMGRAMTTALARLAEDARSEMLSFADFPALVVACARAASTGGLGSGVGGGWHWRALGLSRTAGLGEAVGALLRAFPLEAGAATVALAANGLLAPVWRDLPESSAAQLTAALGVAGRFSPPNWPAEADDGASGLVVERFEPVLARASAFWGPVLRALPRRHEAVRTAATLSLLRWSPISLLGPIGSLWPLLLARLVGAPTPAPPNPVQALALRARETMPNPADAEATLNPAQASVPRVGETMLNPGKLPPAPESGRESPDAGVERPVSLDDALPRRRSGFDPGPMSSAPVEGLSISDGSPLAESPPHGDVIITDWGGVLFLINVLNRLDIAGRLAACGPAPPSGWRVLLELGLALGMPKGEPLAEFLTAQDLEQPPPTGFCYRILDDMQALYAPFEIWPLPLAQPGRLLANETHLDIDLLTQRVDIDMRRMGLDIDPGWVPWLGRIVTFHYPNLTAIHLSGA